MKVLHVIPSLSPQYGGPAIAVRAMAEAVCNKGIEAHIATTDDDGQGHLAVPLEQPIIQNGVTSYYFRRQTKFYATSLPLTRWLVKHVKQYDIVHIHGLFSYVTIPAAYCATLAKIPYIVRPFGTLNRWGIQNRRAFLKRWSLHIIERPLLKRAALIHYTCQQEKIEAQEIGVVGPSIVQPLGINLLPFKTLPPKEQFISRYPQLEGQIVILFLSRIDSKKGLDLLLPAFAQINHRIPQTTLVIVGDGDASYLAQLQHLSRQLGIAQKVIWTGFLTGNEKMAAFAAANIFTLPSYSENFGIAVVEALAAGLPVILSDQVGIHNEVQKSGAGYVVPCRVEALVEALIRLITNIDLQRQFGGIGKRLVEQAFTLDAMTTGLITMYNNVVNNSLEVKQFRPIK